ncbi:hypothetical protein ACLBR5_23770 [Escherichia coli]
MEEKAAIAQLRQFCQNGAGDYENNEIFRQWKAPAVRRPAWRTRVIAASACIACWLNSRRRWTVGPAASGLVS